MTGKPAVVVKPISDFAASRACATKRMVRNRVFDRELAGSYNRSDSVNSKDGANQSG